jgi:predicted nuclease of predicted toxin-antitoxin system
VAIEGLSARLLLDEDVDLALAAALRRHGYDAVHVCEVQRQGMSDEEQLRFATGQTRVLVTHNRNDFLVLAARWRDLELHHPGIVYARRAPVGELLRRLLALLNLMSASELHDVIVPRESLG